MKLKPRNSNSYFEIINWNSEKQIENEKIKLTFGKYKLKMGYPV